MKISKPKFPPSLIQEYGEQVYRDTRRNLNTLEDNSYSSMYVAEACGLVQEKDQEKFRKIILKFAKKFKPSIGWF